jgi:plastocyanin
MKKFFLLALALVLALNLAAVCLADEAAPTVYVTIANGDLMLIRQPVTLTDTDADGLLTINDALFLAHEEAFEGGAEAGYLAGESQWGLSLFKLWGVENGGSYGYYVNNTAAYSLADPLNDGDSVAAFVYTDLVSWSDAFCFFDPDTVEAQPGDTVTLTLLGAAYDENWTPITAAFGGAIITFDGQDTEYRTDDEGKVTFELPEGVSVISARYESATLVPPVCLIVLPEAGEIAA